MMTFIADTDREVNDAGPSLDDVYTERNKCVALAAKLAQLQGFTVGIGQHVGVEWDDDWRNIIFIDLPTGQVSWHIHDSDLPMFSYLPIYNGLWDNHTTEEKYERIVEFCTE